VIPKRKFDKAKEPSVGSPSGCFEDTFDEEDARDASGVHIEDEKETSGGIPALEP